MKGELVMIGPAASVHVRTWAEEFRARGWSVTTVSGGSRGDFVRSVARSWLLPPGATDITVVHSLGRHTLLALLCRRRGRVVTVPWGSEVVAAQGSRWRHAVASAMLARTDLVLTTSRHMAESVCRAWRVSPDKARVVSWGVDDLFLENPPAEDVITRRRAELGCDPGELLVLAPRGTGDVYRHPSVVAAVASARDSGARLRLATIAAPGETGRSDIGDVVLPLMSKPELQELMFAADVVVSVPANDQRSTTVLEALATGTRVITSDAPAYREMRDDGADLTILGEPVERELAVALGALSRSAGDGAHDLEANRQWCRERERRATNFDLIESLCQGESCASE